MDTGDYYFSKETFNKVCEPFSKKKVLQVLEEADLLLLNQGDRKIYKAPDTLFSGKQRPSVYAVTADILCCEPTKTTGTNGTDGTGYMQQGIALSHC